MWFLSLAQDPEGTDPDDLRERVESMRVAFLTKRLSLTSSEAQKFWPVYNEYREKLNSVQMGQRKLRRKMNRGLPVMSDSELEDLADRFLALRKEEYVIQENYHSKFKKVLPIKKVLMLYKAEKEFVKTFVNGAVGRPPRGPRGPGRMNR